MVKKKGRLSSLVMNNKIIAVVSVILSFIIWMWVAIEKSPIESTVIKDVPVIFDREDSVPSQLGLQVFGNKEYTVDITVTGKKFVIQTLDASKFTVYAQTNYVDSAGKKSLPLKATTSADCDIVGLSEEYIDVYFDTLTEKEFNIEPVINTELDNIVSDDLIPGSYVLSQNSIKISGPTSEVNSISGVQAVVSIDKQLSSTTTLVPEIVFKGAKNTEYLTMDAENDITLTVPVLKVVELKTTVSFKNVPSDLIKSPLPFTVSPEKLKVALAVESADEINEISVATIDFADIFTGHNSYNFTSRDISDYRLMDDVQDIRVVVDADGFESDTFTIPAKNVSIKNAPEGFNCSTDGKDIYYVRIIGTDEELKKVTNSEIFAEIDLSGVEIREGANTAEATVVVKSSGSCWGYGKYEVTVNAVKK